MFGKPLTFEEFLARAERSGISDPGSAMMSVLRENRVPGIDVGRIESDRGLNPCGNPSNVVRFLRHVADRGQWGVNLEVRIR